MELTLINLFSIFVVILILDDENMDVTNRNRKIILISLFAALTAVGSFVKIPLPHVPITLQTFFVIMGGNLLGYKYGALSQILYLILGLIGIPIFAYGGGPAYIFQPTFGYLLGYPVCALIIGLLIKFFFSKISKTDSKIKYAAAIFLSDIIGVFIIFLFGLSYLYLNIKYGLYLHLDNMTASLNWNSAIKTTFLIFFPIDLVKVSLATLLTMKLKNIDMFSHKSIG